MAKDKKTSINVQGTAIAIVAQHEADYISLTDIARHRDAERTDYLIQNWLRSRNTIEFLGIWESLNNPRFKPIEFDGFRKQADVSTIRDFRIVRFLRFTNCSEFPNGWRAGVRNFRITDADQARRLIPSNSTGLGCPLEVCV